MHLRKDFGRRHTSEKGLLGITLPVDPTVTLARKIYGGIREAIMAGRLAPGQRLPSTRALAEELDVARGTVVEAFEQLRVEGYVRSEQGSGTFVDDIPEKYLRAPAVTEKIESNGEPPRIASRATDQPSSLVRLAEARKPRPFQPGLPPLDQFPRQMLARLWSETIRGLAFDDLGYGDPAGYEPLRRAIASYLRTARAVDCRAEQVIVTNGAQHALGLAAHVLLDAGEPVWLENPGYRGARAAFLRAGLRIVPVPVDEEGIVVEAGAERESGARLIYVTPSHQYPTGVTTSARRRLQLLEWARRNDAWILEDDYDSEYRYDGAPLPSLHHLDAGGRVVYCGSFSKVLAPGLRIGYLVVPDALIDAFRRIRSSEDHHSSIAVQVALARFLEGGHYGRHLRKLRRTGLARRDALLEAFAEHLPDLELEGTGGGLHAVVHLPETFDDVGFAARAAEAGISLSPLSAYDLDETPQRGFVLGYAAYDASALARAVERLAALLRTHAPQL